MGSPEPLFLDVSSLEALGIIARSKRPTLIAIALLATTVAADVARAQDKAKVQSVVLFYPAKNRYVRAATAIKATLRSQGLEVLSVKLPPKAKSAEYSAAIEKLKKIDPAVVATGGSVATKLALTELPDAQVVFFMVPNALDAPFLADDSPQHQRIAGVTSDISPAVQIAWIQKLVPAFPSLTVLFSNRTRRTARALQDEAARRGLILHILSANRDAFPSAIDTLTSSGTGGVLMVPDASIYNSTTVQRLLVWGARTHKPVWAFSENIVRAGAIGGIFTDATSVGEQTARVIQRILGGAEAASIGLQYATGGRAAINFGTARVIEADIDDRHVNANTVRYGAP